MAVCLPEEGFCPTVSLSRVTLETDQVSNSLIVTVEIVIQESDTGDTFDSFLSDEAFNKHLKVKVIQSTGRRATRFLKRPTNSEHGAIREHYVGRKNLISTKEVSITDILDGREARQYKTVESNENVKFNIPYQFQFRLDDVPNPRHLTYFVFSYMDTENLGQGLDLPIQLQKITGQINFRTIINRSSIRGASDSVVQDYRMIERLGKPDIRINILENDLTNKIKRTDIRTSRVLDEISRPGYFSELSITRSDDDTGAARFWFMMNHRKMVMDNTVFGKLLSRGPKRALDQVVSKCKIRNMTLTRRRVVPLGGERYRSFDPNDREDIIVSVSEKRASINGATEFGNIKQTELFAGLSGTGFKAFTGADLDVGKKTFGLYQYSLELEIRDATVEYISKKYMDLLRTSRKIPRYIKFLEIPNVYDIKKKKLDLQAHYRNKIVPVVREYFEVLSLFQVIRNKKRKRRFRRLLLNMSNPSTRDPRGVYTLQRLVSDLLTELERTINSVSSILIKDQSGNRASSTRKSGTARRSFTVTKTFSETFDSDTPINVGYDYISNSEEDRPTNFDGLRIIGYENLQARLESEMSKHFTDFRLNLTMESLEGESLPLDVNIDTTPISFAPSYGRIGSNVTPLSGQGPDMWDDSGNDLLALRTLSFRMSGDVNNSLFIPAWDHPVAGTIKATIVEQEKSYHTAFLLDALDVQVVPQEYLERCQEEKFLLIDNMIPIHTFTFDEGGSRKASFKMEESSRRSMAARYVPDLGRDVIKEMMFTQTFSSLGEVKAYSAPLRLSTRVGYQQRSSAFDFNRLNPTTPGSIFSGRVTMRDNRELLSNMPFQMKAVVASSLGSSDVRYDLSDIGDPDMDKGKTTSLIYNYLLLQDVKCLVGFRKNKRGRPMLQKPIWRPATLARLRSMEEDLVLCKMERYQDPDVPSIGVGQGLDLPAYDKYFMVRTADIT